MRGGVELSGSTAVDGPWKCHDVYDAFTAQDSAAIERSTQEIGRHLFDHLGDAQPSVFDRRWWDDRIMAWAMQDLSLIHI